MNSFDNTEDQKLATLALATLKRTGAPQAAALRDSTGRTYVAISIDTPELTLDAIQADFRNRSPCSHRTRKRIDHNYSYAFTLCFHLSYRRVR